MDRQSLAYLIIAGLVLLGVLLVARMRYMSRTQTLLRRERREDRAHEQRLRATAEAQRPLSDD